MSLGASADRRLPGNEGLWFFLAADLVLFMMLFGSYSSARAAHPSEFAAARHALMPQIAALNTLYLLTSSWLAATAVHAMRDLCVRQASACVAGAVLFGLAFIATKITEYGIEARLGAPALGGEFLMYYCVITGIHLFHVIGGTGLLSVVWWRLRKSEGAHRDLLLTESGASFWHVVDILWLVIFPLFYLLP